MIRLWCVIALLWVSIWSIGGRAAACSPDAQPTPGVANNCALGVPSSDDASSRHWDAPVRTAAYLTQSVWTSQIHHAELASSPCLESRLPSGTATAAPRARPHAIRPQVQSPLLI